MLEEEEEEKGKVVYKLVDHLILSYLSRKKYNNALNGLCSDSIWLRTRDPQRPFLVQEKLHDKTLEDIIELFLHYGRFDVPSEFIFLEQQLRQISNQFTDSLVNLSQVNKKRFEQRHRLFLKNQRYNQNTGVQAQMNTSRGQLPPLAHVVQQVRQETLAVTPNPNIPIDQGFVLPSSSTAVQYRQDVTESMETDHMPRLVAEHPPEQGPSRRKSKPIHSAHIIKMIETIGTNKLQMRENKEIEDDNWDLGNDFDPICSEFLPNQEACDQLLLDVFNQTEQSTGLFADVVMENDDAVDRNVLEKSRKRIKHYLHDSVEQIVESIELDHGVVAMAVTDPPPLASIEEPEQSLTPPTLPNPPPENEKAPEVVPTGAEEDEPTAEMKRVDPTSEPVQSVAMEDLFGKEEGEVTRSPTEATKMVEQNIAKKHEDSMKSAPSSREPTQVRRKATTRAISAKPRILLECKEHMKPRIASGSEAIAGMSSSQREHLNSYRIPKRSESPRLPQKEAERRRDRDDSRERRKAAERNKEKEREQEEEREKKKEREKERAGRERERQRDRSRSAQRPYKANDRRESTDSTSGSSTNGERNRRADCRDYRKSSVGGTPKIPTVMETRKEQREVDQLPVSDVRKAACPTDDVLGMITKEMGSNIQKSRKPSSEIVYEQMFPAAQKLKNKIPKVKLQGVGTSPGMTASQSVATSEERENAPEKEPQMCSGFAVPNTTFRITKSTMSEARVAMMLTGVQQRIDKNNEQRKHDSVEDENNSEEGEGPESRKRSGDESEPSSSPTNATGSRQATKKRKIDMDAAAALLDRIHKA